MQRARRPSSPRTTCLLSVSSNRGSASTCTKIFNHYLFRSIIFYFLFVACFLLFID
jgi:hypothetical protein